MAATKTALSPDKVLTVDFAGLAASDEDFGRIYSASEGYIDFQDPHTVQQLAKSILKRFFNLQIELPPDRLCPAIPVRYEYIRFLQNLLDTTNDDFSDTYNPSREVIGIDIGVGSSCIYPLLGCATRPNWRFGGTDIDLQNFECATRNVALNGLQSRIRLLHAQAGTPLLPLKELGIAQADFVMCNPPFFTSKQEMLATHLSKKRSPSAVCSGADVEMVTDGGDLGFVLRIVEESLVLRGKVRWYSSMLGKLASVGMVVKRLKELGVGNWAVTVVQAGNITRRWVVAWSWGSLRPRNEVARGQLTEKDILPFPTKFTIPLSEEQISSAPDKLNSLMQSLDIKWDYDNDAQSGLCFAKDNVWSRSARRKRKKLEMIGNGRAAVTNEDDEEEGGEEEPKLVVRISLATEKAQLVIRWLQGHDSVLFESFCGMLKREITVDVKAASA